MLYIQYHVLSQALVRIPFHYDVWVGNVVCIMWLLTTLFPQAYKIYNPDYLGRAIIINNVAKEFPGSKKDTAALSNMYHNLKFSVDLYEDCNDVVWILINLKANIWSMSRECALTTVGAGGY